LVGFSQCRCTELLQWQVDAVQSLERLLRAVIADDHQEVDNNRTRSESHQEVDEIVVHEIDRAVASKAPQNLIALLIPSSMQRSRMPALARTVCAVLAMETQRAAEKQWREKREVS
jgi:hypothetical protein